MPKGWIPTRFEKAKLKEIEEQLKKVGFMLPGSLAVRSYACGKQNCSCHESEDRLHGPYIQWTRKVNGKTVHRRLSEEQLDDYAKYFDEAKRIRRLIDELEEVTLGIVERDNRWLR